eukprot:XP_001691484.1 ubiquitin-like protein [Chlamydomonas reinhardtii]
MLWCRWRRSVRTLSGKTGVVSVLPCDPAAVLLLSTAANEGVPPVLLRLLWRSRRVRLHRSFAAQGILPGSTVFVTSVLYGGIGFTEAEVRRVCDAVEKLARRDAATIRAAVAVAGITHRMFAARTAKQQAARAAAAGSAAAGGVQASVGGAPGTSAVGASPAARTGPGSAGAAVSDYSGAAGAPSAAPQEQAARAAAAGSVAAGGVQASAGGAPGTSAVGASSAARTGPGSAGAAVSRYSGAAGAPSAAQHKVTAAPGARLAGVPQQPRTLRQRAQAEAFK